MSLDYNFEKIKNWKEVVHIPLDKSLTQEELQAHVRHGSDYYYEEDKEGNKTYTSYMNPVTEALIWGLMKIGIGTITEKNHLEVWMRLGFDDFTSGYGGRVYEKFEDTTKGRRYRSVTKDEVHKHIGLTTNVSKSTTTQFYNGLLKNVQRDH